MEQRNKKWFFPQKEHVLFWILPWGVLIFVICTNGIKFSVKLIVGLINLFFCFISSNFLINSLFCNKMIKTIIKNDLNKNNDRKT